MTPRQRFEQLHQQEAGIWVLPNPWDVGSAKLLQHAGAVALATTSSGFAASLGKHDGRVTRDELVAHVAAITAAVDIPLNVDAEYCFADDPGGIPETVELLAAAGACGVSIEDHHPARGNLPVNEAAERVAAAAAAAHRHGIVLTARADVILHGSDFDDALARLTAYREAGADCLYAPGPTDPAQIAAIVALGRAVNVLTLPGGPAVPALGELGVRRVSTGGGLAWAAYGALMRGVRELLTDGTNTYLQSGLTGADRAAFD